MLALARFSSVQSSTLEGAELVTGKRRYQQYPQHTKHKGHLVNQGGLTNPKVHE